MIVSELIIVDGVIILMSSFDAAISFTAGPGEKSRCIITLISYIQFKELAIRELTGSFAGHAVDPESVALVTGAVEASGLVLAELLAHVVLTLVDVFAGLIVG